MSQEERLNEVIRQLRADKRRITNQRKLLLSIILRHEYSSCKEIYYEAKKQDSTLGIATVYRTVQLLAFASLSLSITLPGLATNGI